MKTFIRIAFALTSLTFGIAVAQAHHVPPQQGNNLNYTGGGGG